MPVWHIELIYEGAAHSVSTNSPILEGYVGLNYKCHKFCRQAVSCCGGHVVFHGLCSLLFPCVFSLFSSPLFIDLPRQPVSSCCCVVLWLDSQSAGLMSQAFKPQWRLYMSLKCRVGLPTGLVPAASLPACTMFWESANILSSTGMAKLVI